MKVVITGANSYIGEHIQSYMESVDPQVEVFQLDVVEDTWRMYDFTGCDAVVHVAAIVHRKDGVTREEYQRVNVELTAEIAEKAKAQGVGQFVFLSSMAVYGVEKSLSKTKSLISPKTELKPTSLYGESKYLAEQRLAELESESFRVAIVRPPNVYGPGCRGGYISTYASIVTKLPAIPKAFTSVRQSVLYIDNLSRFIYLLILGQRRGVYTPQDEVSVSAVDIMSAISEGLSLNRKASAFLGLFIYPLFFLPLVKKGYGGVSYDQDSSHHGELDYLIVPYTEGIKRTVLYGTQRDHSHL